MLKKTGSRTYSLQGQHCFEKKNTSTDFKRTKCCLIQVITDRLKPLSTKSLLIINAFTDRGAKCMVVNMLCRVDFRLLLLASYAKILLARHSTFPRAKRMSVQEAIVLLVFTDRKPLCRCCYMLTKQLEYFFFYENGLSFYFAIHASTVLLSSSAIKTKQ